MQFYVVLLACKIVDQIVFCMKHDILNNDKVKFVLWTQSSPFSEMMWLCIIDLCMRTLPFFISRISTSCKRLTIDKDKVIDLMVLMESIYKSNTTLQL